MMDSADTAAEAASLAAIARTRVPLLALLGANAISLVGGRLTLLAIPWFVLTTTGSAARTGLVAACETLAVVLAGFAGSAVVDRLGHKRSSVLADLASGALVALVPALHHTIGLAYWQLLVIVALRAFAGAPGTTARSALVPDVVAAAGLPLERANAAFQAVERGASLVGAPLAGIAIAALGPSNVLWLDAATFLVSAAIIARLVPTPAAAPRCAERYQAAVLTGLRFLRNDRLILAIVGMVALTNLLESPIFAVILPVYANQTLGSAVALGILFACVGGGSLLGAVLYGLFAARLSRRAVFVGAFILLGLAYAALAALPSLVGGAVALLAAGIAAGPINPIIATVRQERVPAVLRGRVFGTITAIAWATMPIGMVAGGYALERLGIRATLIAIAAGYLTVTASMLLVPAFRGLDRPYHPDGLEHAENGG